VIDDSVIEVQCDGLIGPSHNYSGLSVGNVASLSNADAVSFPRMAALQGLEKMKFVHDLGCAQIILPPPLRPNPAILALAQSEGKTHLSDVQCELVRAAWSASTMWSANAATISPASDSADGKTHITIANLVSGVHRAQEASERLAQFQHIFGNVAIVHPALPACTMLADEGAANHMRLSASHADAGVQVFVYGRTDTASPKKFPARQTKKACEVIALQHQLSPDRTLMVQQHPDAIDAGVFHNDVIAMSNHHVLILHEYSFVNNAETIAALRILSDVNLYVVTITANELSLAEAVKSYFYNSQLLTLPSGDMAIIAPTEVRDTPAAAAQMQRLLDDPACPIKHLYYRDVRESMRNGGGPACLRLRIALPKSALNAIPANYRFSDHQYDKLCDIITRFYPEQIAPQDIYNAALRDDVERAHEKLSALF
jgi:succinylarginine dihydrolase